MLQLERDPEGRHVVVVVEQEEIPVLTERDCITELFELAERAQRDADVELVRELGADPAGRLARRSRSERSSLEQDDVTNAEPAQVEGGGGAEGAATDYDNVRRVSGFRSGASRTAASRLWRRRPT